MTASREGAWDFISKPIGERLARWLLMCHDRVPDDELKLTQEFIAQMLGIRRCGVSQAAIVLQPLGLISYTRGHITSAICQV